MEITTYLQLYMYPDKQPIFLRQTHLYLAALYVNIAYSALTQISLPLPHKMTPTQQQFISLLKCGLWGTHPDPRQFAQADWPAIAKMAKEQCVTALITDAMNELAANNVSIDKAILYKANFDAIRIARRNAQMNATLAEITELLNSSKVPTVLLKGQGVAQNYRKPEQRMSGDIDLYVGEKNYDKAVNVLQEKYSKHAGDVETKKHYSLDIGTTRVELHRQADHLSNPMENNYFQRLTKRYLQNTGNQSIAQHPGNQSLLQNPACTKQTPPPQFDALFIFNHLFHHYLIQGIGLRQLCDWARYLYIRSNEIDMQQLKTDLQKTGLLKAWKIFGFIAVDTLGLPVENFPFYEHRTSQGEKVLENIFTGGNFGYYNPELGKRPKGYIASKLFTVRRTYQQFFKNISIFPGKIIPKLFIYPFEGIAQLFREKI